MFNYVLLLYEREYVWDCCVGCVRPMGVRGQICGVPFSFHLRVGSGETIWLIDF